MLLTRLLLGRALLLPRLLRRFLAAGLLGLLPLTLRLFGGLGLLLLADLLRRAALLLAGLELGLALLLAGIRLLLTCPLTLLALLLAALLLLAVATGRHGLLLLLHGTFLRLGGATLLVSAIAALVRSLRHLRLRLPRQRLTRLRLNSDPARRLRNIPTRSLGLLLFLALCLFFQALRLGRGGIIRAQPIATPLASGPLALRRCGRGANDGPLLRAGLNARFRGGA